MSLGYLKKYNPENFIKKRERNKHIVFQLYAKYFNAIPNYKFIVLIRKYVKNLHLYLSMFNHIGCIYFLNTKPHFLLKSKKRRSIKRKIKKKIVEPS